MKDWFIFIKRLVTVNIVFLTISIVSCNSTDSARESSATAFETDTVIEDEKNYFFVLPSMAQIAYVFKRAGLSYQPNLILEADHNRYISIQSKGLIFGVFSSDLAYCLLNEQRQMAIDRFEILGMMSSDLGIDRMFFDETRRNQFLEQSQNLDSAMSLLSEIQESTDNFLEQEEKSELAAIIFTGAWIEGMFLASEASDISETSKLAKRIVEQRTILGTLLRVLADTENAHYLESLISDLKNLKKNMDSSKFLIYDRANERNVLSITQDELNTVRAAVKEIRIKIVNNAYSPL